MLKEASCTSKGSRQPLQTEEHPSTTPGHGTPQHNLGTACLEQKHSVSREAQKSKLKETQEGVRSRSQPSYTLLSTPSCGHFVVKQSQVQSSGFTSVKGRDRTPAQTMPSLLFMEESMSVLRECLSREARQSSQSGDTHLSSRHLGGGGRKVTPSCTVSSKPA